MRLFKCALVAAGLALTAPAWAHGGHGHHHGWDKHRHHAHGWDRRHHHHHGGYYGPRYYSYSQYYYPAPVYAAPVYAAPAPAPGIHIVAPNVYIPFR